MLPAIVIQKVCTRNDCNSESLIVCTFITTLLLTSNYGSAVIKLENSESSVDLWN